MESPAVAASRISTEALMALMSHSIGRKRVDEVSGICHIRCIRVTEEKSRNQIPVADGKKSERELREFNTRHMR